MARILSRVGARPMRTLATVAALALVALGWVALRQWRSARLWDSWYGGAAVAELKLWIAADERASLAAQPRRYVRAELEHAGVRQIVGLRLKGHRSMRRLEEKAAFKVAVDRFHAEQTFHGVRRLTLNNMVEDPTGLREFLGHLVFRAMGVASPRTGYASVLVNDVPFGPYLLVESLDEQLERLEGEDHEAVVYEGEYGCDLDPEDVDGFERDQGKDPGRAALRAFANAAASGRELFDAAAGPLDMPVFLRYLAVSAVIGDFDGYRHSHNYRLRYRPAAGKWQLMPWGLDRTFQRPLGIFDSEGALAKRCFSEPGCRLEYVRQVRQVSDGFEALGLLDTARALAARVDAAGSGKAQQPEAARARAKARRELEEFIRRRPAQIREQLGCIDAAGNELDRDADGHGCMDCDDSDPAISPDATERCDGVDNDCSGLSDDAAACDCPRTSIGGREYHLCNWPLPWAQAARLCADKGLVLARVESKADSAALYQAARRVSRQPWWIGYSDREREGEFRWREGDAGSFAHWDKGQPNDRGCNEDCVALRDGRRGAWQDAPCRQHRPFICGQPTAARSAVAAAGERARGSTPPSGSAD